MTTTTTIDKLAHALRAMIDDASGVLDFNDADQRETLRQSTNDARPALAEYDAQRAQGPECGHSACSQNFIDTGDKACTRVRLVVTMEGGVIQDIATDTLGVEVVVVDYDTEGMDDDEVAQVAQLNPSGDTEGYADAYLFGRYVDHDPTLVALRFEEFAKHVEDAA